METLNTFHSSFKMMRIRSPIHPYQVASTSRFKLSLARANQILRSQRSGRSDTSPFTSTVPLRRSPINCCMVADDKISGSTMKVTQLDSSLALKNKAMEISPELKGASIFLLGINCPMKTSLGKLLADALKYYYFDSDSLVEQAAGGQAAASSFKERDEMGFRDLETEVLKQLSSMGRLVVCTGDGAVQSTTNLAFLRYGISIWIDIPLDMVAKDAIEYGNPASELSSSGSSSEVMDQLILLYGEMRGGYATADATVSLQKVACQLGDDDTNEVKPEDMAIEVLKEIQKLTRVKRMQEDAAKRF